ncbi:hypothetical protein VTI74DRAFT_6154 [Chaetomium olivicolor]
MLTPDSFPSLLISPTQTAQTGPSVPVLPLASRQSLPLNLASCILPTRSSPRAANDMSRTAAQPRRLHALALFPLVSGPGGHPAAGMVFANHLSKMRDTLGVTLGSPEYRIIQRQATRLVSRRAVAEPHHPSFWAVINWPRCEPAACHFAWSPSLSPRWW